MAAKPKRPRDINQLAKLIVGLSTGTRAPTGEPTEPVQKKPTKPVRARKVKKP